MSSYLDIAWMSLPPNAVPDWKKGRAVIEELKGIPLHEWPETYIDAILSGEIEGYSRDEEAGELTKAFDYIESAWGQTGCDDVRIFTVGGHRILVAGGTNYRSSCDDHDAKHMVDRLVEAGIAEEIGFQ